METTPSKSFLAFQAKLKTAATVISLSSNILVTSDLYLPPGKEINPNSFKFVSAGGKIIFDSYLNAGRRQVFQGFTEGEIRGTFGRPVFPEWWGLIPENHDIAINCAIRSYLYADRGNTISLNAGNYIVSSSIDLRESLSQLEGQGCGATHILTSKNYSPKFEDSQYWTKTLDPESHSAIIWIGSKGHNGGQSFRTNIRGISVDGYNACLKWPEKRISIIANTGWVEENHIIEDVHLTSFTGFGIGFNHPRSISTVNGLAIRNFWISRAMRRDSVPILIPAHAGVCSIRSGTIDCRLDKHVSKAWEIEPKNDKPEFVRDWPLFGIIARGAQTIIEGVHLEGMGIGIYVMSTDSPSSVKISCVTGYFLMDENMAYFNDPVRKLGLPPTLVEQEATNGSDHLDEFYFRYSSIVAIGRQKGIYNSAVNHNSIVKTDNIRSLGYCKYLLRDWTYRKEYTKIKMAQQYPNSEASALLEYDRAEPYALLPGVWPDLKCQWDVTNNKLNY